MGVGRGIQNAKIRPRFLPSVRAISDFGEINIRTYVIKDGKPGVFFLSIEADKWVSSYFARSVSGLPYQYQAFTYSDDQLLSPMMSFDYKIGDGITNKSALDTWLTERYCLYSKSGSDLLRYDIHHLPWPLSNIEVTGLQLKYPLLTTLSSQLAIEKYHYSPGVTVVAWRAEKVG